MRIEPPPSPPVASGQRHAAIAAAAPPLEPPGVRARIPRIRAGRTEHVLAYAYQSQLGRVGLAQHYGAGPFDALHHGSVPLRYPVLVDERAVGGPHPRCHLRVLDRDRKTVQRAQFLSPHDGLLRGLCGGHRLVPGQEQIGVQLGVEPVDAVEVELG